MTTPKRTAAHPGGSSPSDILMHSAGADSQDSHPEKEEQPPVDGSDSKTSQRADDTAFHPAPIQDSRDEATAQPDRNSTQIDTAEGEGDSPPVPEGESPDSVPASREEQAKALRGKVTGRFNSEKRWQGDDGLHKTRDEMMKLARSKIKDKWERMIWVYSELDRLNPPLVKEDSVLSEGDGGKKRTLSSLGAHANESPKADSVLFGGSETPIKQGSVPDDGQIQGLSSLPDDWPELASNDSLSSEIAWVQANRLHVVEERPGKATLVHLHRAHSPAPSYAALGWLETSIRSYAKFVDVAARAASQDDGDQSVVKRERVAVDEMRGLLGEMMEVEGVTCPQCGKLFES